MPASPTISISAVAENAHAIYSSELSSREAHHRVHALVHQTALELGSRQEWEEVFQLLSSIPLHAGHMDPDLLRLRSAAVLHEQRRVARVRRRFKCALLAVLVYLFAIAPTVFVHLDNPYRTAHNMSELDWSEGLYWSVITMTTVGYGDIVPQTPYARMFALFNAVLGVTMMGVIAGLVLSAMTPRRIP